jgi:hypothetical protein
MDFRITDLIAVPTERRGASRKDRKKPAKAVFARTTQCCTLTCKKTTNITGCPFPSLRCAQAQARALALIEVRDQVNRLMRKLKA